MSSVQQPNLKILVSRMVRCSFSSSLDMLDMDPWYFFSHRIFTSTFLPWILTLISGISSSVAPLKEEVLPLHVEIIHLSTMISGALELFFFSSSRVFKRSWSSLMCLFASSRTEALSS